MLGCGVMTGREKLGLLGFGITAMGLCSRSDPVKASAAAACVDVRN